MKQYTNLRRCGLIRLAAVVLFLLIVVSSVGGLAQTGSGMTHDHPPGAFRYPPGILTPDSSQGVLRPVPLNPAAKTGGKDVARYINASMQHYSLTRRWGRGNNHAHYFSIVTSGLEIISGKMPVVL